MFDEWRGAGDAELVDAVDASARAESRAAARRLAAIAELVRRRANGPTDCARWSCDNWDAVAAEVAAALNVSQSAASSQMYLAVGLRDRVPGVGGLLAEGTISLRLESGIVWRTALIKDPQALRLVDAALTNDAKRYGPLSAPKTARAIDAIIDRFDPGALRRARTGARGRDVVISPADNASGTASLWGSLLATDAAVLDRRLNAMAHQVCDDDPRTIAQRRADALGTLAAGGERLSCGCGRPDCPSADATDPRCAAVVIHVVADASSMEAQPDPHVSGEIESRPITAQTKLSEAFAPEPAPPAVWLPAAHIVGGAPVPAVLLGDLIAGGAKISPLGLPGEWVAEPGYHPSVKLQRFVRCRDMTCRFPGCDAPAEGCDIDHTLPYPAGPTHQSNLKLLCRKHHLLKTFWSGPGGWRDRQHPDGTVTWTSPTGHVYTTRPGSRLLFPTLCLPTGELPTAATAQPAHSQRGVMMPARSRTREQDRARRIDAERALNDAHVAERSQPPPF